MTFKLDKIKIRYLHINLSSVSACVINVMIFNLTANYFNRSLMAHKNYKIKGFICKLCTFILPIIF